MEHDSIVLWYVDYLYFRNNVVVGAQSMQQKYKEKIQEVVVVVVGV